MKKRIAWLLLCLLLLPGLCARAAAESFASVPEGGSVVMPGDILRYTFESPDAAPPLLRVQTVAVAVDANSVRAQSDGGTDIIFGTDGFVVMCDANCTELTLTFDAVMPETKEMPVCILHIGEERYTIGHTSGYSPAVEAGTLPANITAAESETAAPAPAAEEETMEQTSIWGYVGLGAVILGFAYGLWRQKTAPQRMEKRKAKLAAKKAALNAEIGAAEKEE